jgi:hypothetical protein
MKPDMLDAATRSRLLRATALAAALAAALPAGAGASQLIDRNASRVRLAVDAQGRALVTYGARGKLRRVLARGAINALAPTRSRPQVEFELDYSGGWRTYHKALWEGFRNACRPYDGPKLPWIVTACKAPDGTYWALQSWQRMLPNLGYTPWSAEQKAWELHLSHWTGPTARIEAWTDWVYGGRFHDLFGRLTYRNRPVHGFETTSQGSPRDGYGRNLYLDTFDSVYGSGWRRENSFVAHDPDGVFCYGFYPFDPRRGGYVHPPGQTTMRGPGNGSRYRMTVIGPGVTPDVMWTGRGLHDYDPQNPDDVAYERRQNALLDSIVGAGRLCRHH